MSPLPDPIPLPLSPLRAYINRKLAESDEFTIRAVARALSARLGTTFESELRWLRRVVSGHRKVVPFYKGAEVASILGTHPGDPAMWGDAYYGVSLEDLADEVFEDED